MTGIAALAIAASGLAVPAEAATSSPGPAPAPVIPQPVSEVAQRGTPVTLTADTTVVGHSRAADFLAEILRRSTGFKIPMRHGHGPAIVLDGHGERGLGDEGYRLTARGKRITLTAHTDHGLFNAVQTLRQLLPAKVEAGSVQPGPWQVAPVEVKDNPRFAYRATMLDVGRRFYPVADVERYIDQVAQYKINTLHLHLTDDQGWRIAIGRLPQLTKVGGTTQSGWTGGSSWYYTANDYRRIVAYAKSRFIDIVPEIDGPGHTSAALAAIAKLNCDDKARAPYHGFDVGISLLCLSDDKHRGNVRDYLRTVISTVAAMSPGRYVHIGGDETPSTPVADYASYVSMAGDAVRRSGKRVIGWHEIAQGPLPRGSIMQYWGDDSDRASIGTAKEAADITQARQAIAQHAGFVISPADHSYLDMKYDASTPYGLKWEGYVSVQKSYDWDPLTTLAKPDGTGSLITERQVAGVEASLWADRAYSGSNSLPTSTDQFPEPAVYTDFMAFPRLPGIAEIGWSPRATHDWANYKERLAAQADRWTNEGIGYNRTTEIWPK